MVPGSYINALAKQVENYDLLKRSGLSLLDEGKELVQDARRSLREEGGVSPTHFATVRITPFLMRLEGFAREFFDIQRTAAKKWIASPDGGVLGLTTKEKTIQAAEHELQYRELEVWFSQFTVNPVVASSFIDGNRFLASLSASPEIRVTLADSGYSIQMDPSHLSAACGLVAAALRSVASSVNKRAIDNAFLNEMILKEGCCDETQESVEACKTWLGARHALFGDQRIHCWSSFPLSGTDELHFECDAPSCLGHEWDAEIAKLEASLAPVGGIISPYVGKKQVVHDPESEVVRVTLTLPMVKNSEASSSDSLSPEYSELRDSAWQEASEQKHIWIPHEFTNTNGESKQIVVHTPGAGLLTPLARQVLSGILSQAEKYARCIPSLDSLCISAAGDASDFTYACETGRVLIALECSEGDATAARSWNAKQRLSFTSKSFFRDSVYEAIEALSRRATIVRLPCKQDQETRYMGGASHAEELVSVMVENLAETIGALVDRYDLKEVQLEVTEHSEIFEVFIGSQDTIFNLRILDSENRIIGVGSFSRHFMRWQTRLLDVELNGQIERGVNDILQRDEPQNLTAAVLSRELAARNITLPTELVRDLVSAAKGEYPETRMGDYLTVEQVVEQALNDPYAEIVKKSDTVELTRHVPDIQRVSYGTQYRRQPNGSMGDAVEIFSFEVAKDLHHREGFKPNENFIKRLEEEREDEGFEDQLGGG
jgi:hypothetical protein